jgi:hypothetical protein
MEPFEPDPSHPEFEVEMSDLATPDDEPRTPSGRGTRKRPLLPKAHIWRLVLGGSAVLLLLLVVLLSLYPNVLPHWFIRPGAPMPLELRPQQGLACLIDATWSPNGHQVALLGYQNFCAGVGTPKPGVVAIYDAATGRLLKQVQPDRFILHALQEAVPELLTPTPSPAGSPAGQPPSILYQRLLWSLDRSRLALTFWVSRSPSTPPLTGLVVLDPDQITGQVWIITDPAQDLNAAILWDTVSGLHTSRFGTPQFFPSTLDASFAITYPVAVSYQWETTGDLLPQTPLPLAGSPPAAAPGSIGDPNFTRTFSLWQPGIAELMTHQDVGPSYTPGVYMWHTTLAAWSPDGHFLLTDVDLGARLIGQGVPTASSQAVHDLGFEQLPLLSVRDAGLTKLLQTIDPAHPHALAVSWRPDGRILATDDLSNGTTPSVTLYDCTNGSKLASLQPLFRQPPGLTGPTVLLRWAPDGTHLLFFAPQSAAVTIWGSNQLPG